MKKIKIALLLTNLGFLIWSIVQKNHLLIVSLVTSLVYLLWICGRWKRVRKKQNFMIRSIASIDIIVLLMLILFLRLYKVQIIDNAKYKKLIKKQVESVYTFRGKRGSIYDRQGREIAYDIHVYDIIIDPYMLDKTKETKKIISDLFTTLSLKRDKNKFLAELEKDIEKKRRYKLLGVELNNEERAKVVKLIKDYKLRDNEIILKEQAKRIYPRGEIYQNIIGVMGFEKDSDFLVGINGIEKQYEDYLKGKVLRKRVSAVKNRSFALPTAREKFSVSSKGKDVYLTLEEDLQYLLNDEIKKQFEETDSEEAYGIIVNPNTGEILAISTFRKDESVVRNPVFQNQLEPGSIFKPIVVAGAIEDGYINEDSTFDVKDGRITKYRHTIKEATRSIKGIMSVRDILAKSSNVGMVLISDEFTNEVMEGYLKKFGFYNKTGVDFPYEKVPYHMPLKKWDGLKKNTTAFGQGIVVTPIQMIMAFSSVVNGGILYKPYLMEKIVDSETGAIIRRNTPEEVRRTISKETSEKMKAMLEDVVAKGGGARAKVSGYRIGGKTGTAQISAGRGGYLRSDYLTSFIGAFPADNPKYVGLIMFYKPSNVARKLGGLIAAPVFSNIIKRLTITREIVADDISKIKITETDIENINYQTTKTKIYIMPDIKGKTMREVVDIFSGNQIDLKITGTGKVKEFYPAPGTELFEVEEVKVILE
ncbi:penicillin-binding protein [Fusobacterium sp.]|uniref:penicillin-binding protein n=1 Tax=Fusobacterium sp. TaxID=68766 RepID=UPI00262C1551|nr:penicillin-binding protein [Fusobacterium sp.]